MSMQMLQQVNCNVATINVTKAYHFMTEQEKLWRDFGMWLKTRRESLGLSQEGAAHKIGKTRQQWNRYESGLSGARRDTVLRIVKEFNLDEQDTLARAGFASQTSSIKKPKNVAEFFEILEDLGMDVQFSGGLKMLETLDEDELQELLDGMLANASAKARRKMQAK